VHRWTSLAEIPADFGPSVVTIGNFDGVHRGHVSVLTRMVADARAVGAEAAAVTFSPHPAQVHRPREAPELLTGDVDRLELLAETGLDAVLMLEYTLEFAAQTPEEFVRRYLVDGLRARTVVVGRDVRFGRDNSGDIMTMVALGERYGFDVDVLADVSPQSSHRRWSSTWVRELLESGDVAGAARVLGRPHRMRGVVVHGAARGRDLGFPTANLAQSSTGMVPADGVYAGRLRLTTPGGGGLAPEVWPAAISIGTNPTFDGVERRVEAYVLDRTDLELYGQEVLVEFVEQLRPTLRFDSVDALVDQMHEDVGRARDLLV
jgi:riboflavin kinase/FMN adenylyltransferase